jgi:hypothetical protein
MSNVIKYQILSNFKSQICIIRLFFSENTFAGHWAEPGTHTSKKPEFLEIISPPIF